MRAPEAIGWRGGDSAGPDEVALAVLPAIVDCVREHGDRALLYRQVAEVLRSSGPGTVGRHGAPSAGAR